MRRDDAGLLQAQGGGQGQVLAPGRGGDAGGEDQGGEGGAAMEAAAQLGGGGH